MDTDNRPQEPVTQHDDTTDPGGQVAYAGFWIRVLASVLDTLLLMMVVIPLLFVFYDAGDLLTASEQSPGLAYELIVRVMPVLAVLVFWRYRAATPGKIMMEIYIVDADTLGQPGFGRLLLRYLGYYVSILTLFLGFLWVAWDKRKQGFHDKIANTVVIRKSSNDDTDGDETEYTQPTEPDRVVAPQADAVPGTDPWKE